VGRNDFPVFRWVVPSAAENPGRQKKKGFIRKERVGWER
jgi:hypothetical protein